MSPTFSASSWQQPVPATGSAARRTTIASVATRIHRLGPRRLAVAVDGRTAAGKTSFGHELAIALERFGRTTYRASLDDFKRPWREAEQYDRKSGEGYYRNAFDIDRIRTALLAPVHDNGVVTLCGIDPLTQLDHGHTTTAMAEGGVLVVDGVFACRPELLALWDYLIWLEIDPESSVRRGVGRDTEREGRAEAERLHRDRYLAAEQVYLAEVDPRITVQAYIDNNDFAAPCLIED